MTLGAIHAVHADDEEDWYRQNFLVEYINHLSMIRKMRVGQVSLSLHTTTSSGLSLCPTSCLILEGRRWSMASAAGRIRGMYKKLRMTQPKPDLRLDSSIHSADYPSVYWPATSWAWVATAKDFGGGGATTQHETKTVPGPSLLRVHGTSPIGLSDLFSYSLLTSLVFQTGKWSGQGGFMMATHGMAQILSLLPGNLISI